MVPVLEVAGTSFTRALAPDPLSVKVIGFNPLAASDAFAWSVKDVELIE